MTLNLDNYFSPEAMKEYFSVSQFKAFERCEASALADIQGEYEREVSTSLLVGSYVDAAFSDRLDEFVGNHPEIIKRDGTLKSEYVRADEMIHRIEQDNTMMEYLAGEKQAIMSADLFGYPWKIAMDVYVPDKRIVDLKTVKDLNPIYEEGYGWRHPIEYWGWDLQGAIYQTIEQIVSGRDKPLPFYLAIVTKEKTPEIQLFELPQHILNAAINAHGVEAKIDRFALIKAGEVPPIRCEHCDYCKKSRVIERPTVFEIKEAL